MKENQARNWKLATLSSSLGLIMMIAALDSHAAVRCHRGLVAPIEAADLADPRPLKEAETKELKQTVNAVWNRMLDFKERMSDRAALIRVKAKFSDKVEGVDKEFIGVRDALVISLKDMSAEEIKKIRDEVEDVKGTDVVSFPLRMAGGHLHTAFRGQDYDFLRVMNSREYSLPLVFQEDALVRLGYQEKDKKKMKSSIETLVPLTELEANNLATYLHNIKNNTVNTIGDFNYAGATKSNGKLDSNRCAAGGHNCTSWMALAPIGSNNESLMALLHLNPETQWGTNPGYLTAALLAEASAERQPLVLIYTSESVPDFKQKLINQDGILDWDYDLH